MAHVSLRMSEQEKNIMEEYAAMHGQKLSEAIKEVFFERLEDEFDLAAIKKFENTENKEFISFDDVVSNLGFKDEV